MSDGDTSLALACDQVRLTIGGRTILEDVSFGLSPGEVLGVAGPNGAGKTSLFDVLSGRRGPSAGSITLAGREVTGLPIHRLVRLGLGRTFQTPIVPGGLTIEETLEAARKAFRPRRSRLDAEWATDLVGLRSGGRVLSESLETLERRKLLLACVMMRRPSVLLMDEPASGLVASEIDELDQILKRIAWELKVAVAVVEHRLELIASITDRVLVLDAGGVIADGPAEETFDLPVVRAAYFQEVS